MPFKSISAALLFTAVATATPALSSTISLNFAGLNGNLNEQPLNYYNGGLGGLGSGPGPNYGISFGSDAITGSPQPGGSANTAMLPTGGNVLFFLTGGGDIMNKAAGFDTGFSFYYSAVNVPGTVSVWSGLNGTGTLLASLILPVTPNGASIPGCSGANFCPFQAAGVSFAGTAESVNFSGTANQIGFADITLGASTPVATTPLPPTWTMMLIGLAGFGFVAYRRKSKPALMAA
jgi:hypothetical protein